MIGVRLSVPIACWRKAHARELLETEVIPPPATCYGALLSLVGESDLERHVGARVSAGLFNAPTRSTVLRTLWRIKDPALGQGNKKNARPDFQQLVVGADLLVLCDSSGERRAPTLEDRVRSAFSSPEAIQRFGGWCLGESTHLINDAWLLDALTLPSVCQVFVCDDQGDVTLPVWVDHVGTRGTRYVVGSLVAMESMPEGGRLPRIDMHRD